MTQDSFTITPLGLRVFEKMEKEKCTLDQALWKIQKEDGVSLLKRTWEVIKGFWIKLKYKRGFWNRGIMSEIMPTENYPYY